MQLFSLFRARLTLVFAGCFLALGAFAQTPSDEFTVIVLPDTQHYSRNYPEIFASQTRWIADNASSMKIKFVVGVGDIVNNGESYTQYQNADAAISTLDRANIPYVLALGNHDYVDSKPSSRNASVYNRYFGPARYSGYSWYRGHYPSGSNENFYAVFDVNGRKYLVLALELYPRESALQWASSVIKANLDKQVIVTTHSFVNIDNTRVDRCDYANAESMGIGQDNDGAETWSRFVSQHPTIFMVLNGHLHGVGRRTDVGVHGNRINQVLSNYQHEHRGGNGYLRIMRFKPSLNQVEVRTFSPYANSWRTDSANQFTLRLAGVDGLGVGQTEGVVRGNDCQEIAAATVSYSGGSAKSNAAGRYSIPAAAPSTLSVSAGKTGWDKQSQSAKFYPNITGLTEYYLRPALPCALNGADNTVTLCTPRTGSSAGSPLYVAAGARSSAGISALALYIDGRKLYETTSDRITHHFGVAAGTRQVTVKAWSKDGHSFQSSATVNVTSGSSYCSTESTSEVAICRPSGGSTLTSPVRVTARAISSKPVTSLALYLDGTKVYQVASDRLDTYLGMGVRSHRLTIQAKDSGGSTFSKTASFEVKLPAAAQSSAPCSLSSSDPSVTICIPGDGAAVSTSLRVVAGTTSSVPVRYMQIYLDGSKVYQGDGASLDANITLTPGNRRLVVQAKNVNDQLFKKTIYVTAASTTAHAIPQQSISP